MTMRLRGNEAGQPYPGAQQLHRDANVHGDWTLFCHRSRICLNQIAQELGAT